jgi:hypothetical protein
MRLSRTAADRRAIREARTAALSGRNGIVHYGIQP